jgi:nucleoid DNA-binding protein
MKQFSKKVKILPWEGKYYNQSSPKILILGMSTYNNYDKKRDCVKIMVKKLCNGSFKDLFWSKTKNLLANDNEDIKDFWNRVSIYEYIQEIMPEPGVKTPKKYWEEAEEPFEEILNKLQPDIVVVMGFGTFTKVAKKGKKGKTIKKNGNEMETCIYEVNNKNIVFCRIKHTAAWGWNKDNWRKLFSALLKRWGTNIK